MEALRGKRHIDVLVVLFDDFELLDLYGPLELLSTYADLQRSSWPTLAVRTASVRPDWTARAADGPQMVAQSCVRAGVAPADVLLLPGGNGVLPLIEDAPFLSCLRALAEASTVVITVCTASLLLAHTGLLDGLAATTNKIDHAEIAAARPATAWDASARWVAAETTEPSTGRRATKFFTSSGISAGADLTAHMLQLLSARGRGEGDDRSCGGGGGGGGIDAEAVCAACGYTGWSATLDPRLDPFAGARATLLSTPLRRARRGEGCTEQPPLAVAALAFDGCSVLQLFGPLEMLGLANRCLADVGEPPAFEVRVWAEHELVQPAAGPRVVASPIARRAGLSSTTAAPARRGADAHEAPVRADVLLVPGGRGSLRALHSATVRGFVREAARGAGRVLGSGGGVALLASVGALDGARAVAPSAAGGAPPPVARALGAALYESYGARVRWVRGTHAVVDGRAHTSDGASAATDLALELIADACGEELATRVSTRAEYAWTRRRAAGERANARAAPSMAMTLVLVLARLLLALSLRFWRWT